jgi:hypothetical protein
MATMGIDMIIVVRRSRCSTAAKANSITDRVSVVTIVRVYDELKKPRIPGVVRILGEWSYFEAQK